MVLLSVGRGIELRYEDFGEGEPLVLIMGFGQQLVMWDEAFCRRLAAEGFRVIRFDHRDVGLSTRLDQLGAPPLGALLLGRLRGRSASPPCTLHDMAVDTLGLVDALGIASAHVVGQSLGGMIAQELVLAAPGRVRSLALVMSSSGALRRWRTATRSFVRTWRCREAPGAPRCTARATASGVGPT